MRLCLLQDGVQSRSGSVHWEAAETGTIAHDVNTNTLSAFLIRADRSVNNATSCTKNWANKLTAASGCSRDYSEQSVVDMQPSVLHIAPLICIYTRTSICQSTKDILCVCLGLFVAHRGEVCRHAEVYCKYRKQDTQNTLLWLKVSQKSSSSIALCIHWSAL